MGALLFEVTLGSRICVQSFVLATISSWLFLVLKMHVVVCGAGIVGASVTYYLAKRGVKCTVIERSSPACAASGKAGGFLAQDWCDHNELGPLARLSFDLHSKLAEEFGAIDIDYRSMDALAVRVKEGC